MKPSVTVKVPGRICLMGDKVDLLGKPVIGMAINLMMTVKYQERENNCIEFYSHDTNERSKFRLGELAPRNIDLEYWSVLYERLKSHVKKGFYMDVSSDIPIGVGTIIRRRNSRSGKPGEGTMEVVEFEPNRVFELVIHGDMHLQFH